MDSTQRKIRSLRDVPDKEVIDEILYYKYTHNGNSPSLRELCELLEISPKAVASLTHRLEKLVKENKLHWVEGGTRKIGLSGLNIRHFTDNQSEFKKEIPYPTMMKFFQDGDPRYQAVAIAMMYAGMDDVNGLRWVIDLMLRRLLGNTMYEQLIHARRTHGLAWECGYPTGSDLPNPTTHPPGLIDKRR